MPLSISNVSFNGASLPLISNNGKAYAAIRPICEAMGVDSNAQIQKIKRDLVLNSVACVMHATGSDGKRYEMLCLPLEYLNGWLFKIDARRIHDQHAQTAVIKYQYECYAALNAYWSGKTVSHKHEFSIMNLTALCSHMVWLEGWWHRYGDAVQGFNRNVAAAVHDHFNDGAFVAGQFIGLYGLDVAPSGVARNYPWDGSYEEKHDYWTLTKNEKRKTLDSKIV